MAIAVIARIDGKWPRVPVQEEMYDGKMASMEAGGESFSTLVQVQLCKGEDEEDLPSTAERVEDGLDVAIPSKD